MVIGIFIYIYRRRSRAVDIVDNAAKAPPRKGFGLGIIVIALWIARGKAVDKSLESGEWRVELMKKS